MALNGLIPWGIVATVSMQRGVRQVLEPGSLDVSGDIFLLLGYDYEQALARTEAGSLQVESTSEGIRWKTVGHLSRSPALRDTYMRMDAGLLGGVVPGFVDIDVEDVNGVKVVRQGMLCEINLVARPTGDGSTLHRRGQPTGRPRGRPRRR